MAVLKGTERVCACMCVCVRMNMQFVVSVNFAFNFLMFPHDFLNTLPPNDISDHLELLFTWM